ncbi:MAG: head GIN domain-containing protein [Sediminibacterium sp.]|nr:head GIN domain-containing protein [Sediminibacterium sp.]
MKKICLFLGIGLFLLQTVQAQNEIKEANSQKRTVSSFHGIEASAGVQVFITRGDKEELAVSVDNVAYLEQVKTTVSNGVLRISRENDWKFWNMWKNYNIRVYVSYTNLDVMEANSGSSIIGTSVALQKLKAEVNSGGQIKLSGKLNSLDVESNSGGNFKGNDLEVVNCKADANSGGTIQINVSKELSAEASSGGSIRYKGEAMIRNINTGSGGSVKKLY